MSATSDEIGHQGKAWADTIDRIPDRWQEIAGHLPSQRPERALFVGSGTSLYLAQSAARCWQEITGIPGAAVPSSEVFLSPAATVGDTPGIAFVISRSGTTSEAVLAARYLRDHLRGLVRIGVTCHEGTELEAACTDVLMLPAAAESSVVMTQSFTSMLLALQIVSAQVAGNHELLDRLRMLPDEFDRLFSAAEAFARGLAENRSLERFIYLGLGPYYGLAEEATLKLKEMTQTPCEAYNPLEFRHGPISIVETGTAIVLLEGEREREYMPALEDDLAARGAHLAVLGPYASHVAPDSLRLPDSLDDLSRSVLYLPPLQMLAMYRALTLGLNPDEPRNLSQVVVLKDASTSQ